MPVENTYPYCVSDFYATDESASWSVDIDIPAQTVYASAALSRLVMGQPGTRGYAFCGIMFYATFDEAVSPAPVLHVPSPNNNGLAPVISDSNVVLVAFGYGAAHAAADCNFLILGNG
jgi:hypothetical protein